jgi:hypothetical protein
MAPREVSFHFPKDSSASGFTRQECLSAVQTLRDSSLSTKESRSSFPMMAAGDRHVVPFLRDLEVAQRDDSLRVLLHGKHSRLAVGDHGGTKSATHEVPRPAPTTITTDSLSSGVCSSARVTAFSYWLYLLLECLGLQLPLAMTDSPSQRQLVDTRGARDLRSCVLGSDSTLHSHVGIRMTYSKQSAPGLPIVPR